MVAAQAGEAGRVTLVQGVPLAVDDEDDAAGGVTYSTESVPCEEPCLWACGWRRER
ncbi:hypothetical protein ACH4TS_06810 [Streptomyces albidoflavus]